MMAEIWFRRRDVRLTYMYVRGEVGGRWRDGSHVEGYITVYIYCGYILSLRRQELQEMAGLRRGKLKILEEKTDAADAGWRLSI